MLKFTIKPLDVLIFGSGKPFNMGGVADSIFPPFPHSFASAVFAKFYSETKIAIANDKGIYKAVYGPFLEKDSKIYFPAPLNIMKEKKKEDKGKITTSYRQNNFKLLNIQDTDLDEKLKELLWTKAENTDIDFEPFKGFISLDGLKKWYKNQQIDNSDLLLEKDIFIREDRIAIYKDDTTGTVKEEDGLYRVGFIRLKDDVNFVFWIEANFDDGSLLRENKIKDENKLKEIFDRNPQILKIGGETRTASYKVEIDNFKSLFSSFNNNLNNRESSSNKYRLLFLTSGIFMGENVYDKTIIDYFDDGKFITGTIAGYDIAGISSKYYDKYKNKTVRAIKPGSVIYLEKENNNFAHSIDFYNSIDSFIGANLVLLKIYNLWR